MAKQSPLGKSPENLESDDLFAGLRFEKMLGWEAPVYVASLKDCYSAWYTHWDEVAGPDPDERDEADKGIGTLLVVDEGKEGITDAQRAAYRYFRQHEDQVCRAMLQFVAEEIVARGFSYDLLPAPATADEETRAALEHLQTPGGVRELIDFTSLVIRREEADGAAYSAIEFNSCLDEEHGFSILMHKDKAIRWAGGGEFGGDV